MVDAVEIFELGEAEEKYIGPIRELLAQLSSSEVVFSLDTLEELVSSSNVHLFIATCNGNVCGMLTLAHYAAPTGRKLWIEDVVVDSRLRGKSVGRSLVQRAVEKAREIGGTLMLTSKPARVAANALYRSSGFEQKETNVYRMNV